MKDFNPEKGAVAGVIFLVVTGAVTGLIPNPVYIRMVSITFLDYVFLFTTSLFATYYFGKNKCSVKQGRLAGLGGLTGFLGFGCPVCNVFFVSLFSSSTILAYFEPVRPFLGVFSTVVLGLLIYRDLDTGYNQE